MYRIDRASDADFADAWRIVNEYFDAIALPPAGRDDRDVLRAYLPEPNGLWLARGGDATVGLIALRRLDAIPGACEVKRLFVQPAHRGARLADALLDALEASAERSGYTVAYLDTRADLVAALAFYRRRGYEPCERYSDNPEATNFMRRRLGTR
ncbi:MAG: GNAT family N-acetyltransferase [Vulcanimicrobiaceae bacterium]